MIWKAKSFNMLKPLLVGALYAQLQSIKRQKTEFILPLLLFFVVDVE